jgi:hypothetical protein
LLFAHVDDLADVVGVVGADVREGLGGVSSEAEKAFPQRLKPGEGEQLNPAGTSPA